jgi:hypothetical protein
MSENSSVTSSQVFKRHLSRLRSSLSAHSPATICDFMTTHTFLRGRPFSFEGHEYQREILEDPAKDIVIVKSAQLGISEMSARLALARCVLLPGFTTIYTLPTMQQASQFMQTRVSPVIAESPYLREVVSTDVDNASVKRFGASYLWVRGSSLDKHAISIPADGLVVDEINNSNQEVITLFESRLIHSPYALTVKLSTPTVPNYGVDALFKQSKRKFNFCQCNHCNHYFLPSYFDHVKIPGFDRRLQEIRKDDFESPTFRWADAYIECPSCHREVDLINAKREWVVENPEAAFTSSGYQISPFDCPTIIKPSALVKSSVSYARPIDFYNQRLGLSLDDSESSLLQSELEAAIVHGTPEGLTSYVIGLDVGSTCWLVLCAVSGDGGLLITKTLAIPIHTVVQTTIDLVKQYRVRMLVIDRGPSLEVPYQIQQRVRNSFAAVFVQSKNIELFKVTDREGAAEKGVEDMRQVNISRDAAMDVLMTHLRVGKVHKLHDDFDRVWVRHMCDNKRVQVFRDGELVTTWVKTQKVDHLHMALLYAFVASRILGVSTGSSVPLPLLSSFRVQPAQPAQ